ncbi:XdhC family protein [Streptomyces albidoflavus]|uniref:XshC-Cox1-family protein n=1 Tax=Streptomyces albidoflavus TaxID=1886 RepID=A0A8G2A0N3_9ACTN|nr:MULTISPECIES: XdhC/CoxI family protein [Streptomyces]MYW59817.1 XdhC/CoxI family protein [Streptomyces sp. SID8370]MYW86070.1 XdhC/CoxI family protein [Streptomyces sp. SID8371]ALM37559.1 xanthine and CO dehydrogenases maturation factor, XdhC/CoxF family [Streptomyces sp. FR-008]KAF0791886.1 xanthine dehydrogenase accessory factor [Streptomyces sp. FR-008]MBV7651838.1 XdhC family protein [Streptomyces albidoflavus]
MLDIAAELHGWTEQDRDFAVATVVAVSGSAPRRPGAALAVDAGGTVIGSVSGGCVEGAVYDLCRQAIEDGHPVRERFGYSDDDAFAVGLTCGGVIDILVTPVRRGDPARPVLAAALAAAIRGEAAALALVTEGPAELLGLPLLVRTDAPATSALGAQPAVERAAASQATALLDAGRTAHVTVGGDGSPGCGPRTGLLVVANMPAPRMIVFGAIDFASALVRIGRFLGYRVTLCDARPVFATAARFPDADEIVVDWPHRYLERTETDARTVLCVLTHDAKFDIPLLRLALTLPVAYVGAMGSRRTHLDRNARLREAGLPETALARLRSPIGLDLGAHSPEETALSIAAEIVALRRGGTGVPLRGAHTPIHHDEADGPEGRVGSAA